MSPDADETTFEPEALLAQARRGEVRALGELLARYRNYLALVVRLQLGGRLKGKVDVEDLIQETSLQAHRNLSLFRGATEREFLAWLREILGGVLGNQIRHYYGTQRRDPRRERALNEELERSSAALAENLAARQSSPSQQAERREQVVLLADALESLPEDYREVIILRQLQDLTFPEVARRMGRSEDSVKNLWARALSRLRRAMEAPPR